MKPEIPPLADGASEEVVQLIETLHKSGRRLEDLTAGEVDAVTDRRGQTLLLRRSQDELVHGEAARQTAILNSLRAHIALLDRQGRIVSTNEAWGKFPCTDAPQGAGHAIGLNYLELCDSTGSGDSVEARQVAEGIRSVLDGGVDSFSLEYSCSSPEERYWFQLTVTPLGHDPPTGAVVMHLDISERKRADEELLRFGAAMDATADAIYLVDRATMRFIHVNATACRMQGLTREELIALGPAGLLGVPRAELESSYDAIIASGKAAEPVEVLRPRNNGTQAWVEFRRHALRSDAGWIIVTLVRDITERKLAEDAILRERNFTELTLESLPGLFYVINDEGRFLRWNRNFETVSGYTAEEVSRQSPLQYFSGADQDKVADTIARVFASGESSVEADFVAKDQGNAPYFFTGKRVQIENKPCLIGMGLDISERRQAEQRSRESERRFSDMLGNVELVSLMLDSEARITYCNDYFLRLTGWHREEIIGKNWIELFLPPDAGSEPIQVFAALLADAPEAAHHENEILTRAGERRLIRWNNSVLRSGSGDVIGTASIGEDITEQKRAEKNLLASELRFRQMAENIDDVFFLQNLDNTKMYYVSPAYQAIWGRTCGSLYENPASWGDSIHPADRARVFASFTAGRNTGFDYEFRIERPDGALRWIHVRGFPILDDAGRPYRIAGVATDITEQKQDEIRIKRLNRVYAVLSGINTLIVRVRTRDELFTEACRIAVEHGRFKMAWIGVVDPEAMKILPGAFAGEEDPEFLTLIKDISLREGEPGGDTMAARAIREKKAIVSNEIRNDPRVMFVRERTERGIASMAILPLLVAGGAVGLIVLYADEPGFFDAEEMKLLDELAGDIAFAMENIGRREKLAQLARTRAVFGEINAAIVRIQDCDELFKEVCRIAIEAGQFRLAWIGIANRDTHKIDVAASAGDEQGHSSLVRSTADAMSAKGTGLASAAIQTGKRVVCNDIASDTEVLAYPKEALARGLRAAIALPLLRKDKTIGALHLYASEPNFFDAQEIAVLDELAGNISFAIAQIDKQARLDYLGYYDELTGLANSKLFLDRVAQYMRSAAAGGHKLALFLLDLERFKNLNDSLGRPAGDALLRQVAEFIARNEGDANLVARVGPDHFAVVMPQVKEESEVARHLQKSGDLFRDNPFLLDGTEYRMSARIGVALFPDDGTDAGTLFKNAEAALKKAKASGERYLFYTQAMTEKVAGKLTLENQMRQAIDREEFVLHYQPKVSLVSGKVTSAEALIRWNDPSEGMVPPGRFIPILEETGMIHEVGRWALRNAVENYLRWRAMGLPAVRVAVNVSPLQLRDPGFVGEIAQLIGIDAHAAAGLELEITESLIMEDIQHNISSLKAIRDMGVSIAIDDFGTGFSSLAYLARLPVDTLKIDRSFVTEMTASPQGLALVSTVIDLAHSLNLKVVAEGVETEAQANLLRLLKCEEMQGYLFSKPLPAEIFEAKFLGFNDPAKQDR